MKFEFNDHIFLPNVSLQLSFELAAGEVMVISGPNGVGKTTFLKKVFSEINSVPVAYCPQNNLDLFYDRTLGMLKQIFCSLKLAGFEQAQFDFLWTKFGLHQKENKQLSQLSGGESQSLKICLTIAKQSDLYLLDEPTQFLDDKNKLVLRDYIDHLSTQGKRVLLVDHQGDWISSHWTKFKFKHFHQVLMGEKV